MYFLLYATSSARRKNNKTDDEKIRKILDETGDMVKTISMHATPAETGMKVYQIVKDITGVNDPYKDIKQQHISFHSE